MMTLVSLPSHIYFFAAILGVLLLAFILFSLIPSFAVARQLNRAIKRLKAMKGTPDGSLDQVFRDSGVLAHLWQEYADSLHQQAGEGGAPRFRSTMPAGMVFRPDVLVDIPLHADFFKHLPGLFTGVGIIGTFYGLLIGMQSFVVSENPVVVRASLTRLLHGVSEAFLVSASAITLAMIVTFIEKLISSRLNSRVEQLVQLLDGLFEGGAGEEYLARLVKASETSSAQTAVLLKGELKQILTELSERQMAATQDSADLLGDRMVASIEEGLRVPLEEIAAALKHGRDDQGEALRSMLAEVMGGVSVQLESMSAQLARSIESAELRQAEMSMKLGDFIEQMKSSASESSNDVQDKLQNTLDELSGRMGAVFDGLNAQVHSSAEASMRQQANLEQQSQEITGQFGEQLSTVVAGVNLVVAEMKSAVEVMHATTGDAMLALNDSAKTLSVASEDFARAGQHVSSTLEKSASVAERLVVAADTVSDASTGLSGLFEDYRLARDSMIEQVRTLQMLAERVSRDASMSGEVLSKIEAATGKLIDAQKDADDYLSRISDVIGVAHQSFSEGMTRAVSEANRDFHQALSDSVKLLREGIQELESTLDAVTGI